MPSMTVLSSSEMSSLCASKRIKIISVSAAENGFSAGENRFSAGGNGFSAGGNGKGTVSADALDDGLELVRDVELVRVEEDQNQVRALREPDTRCVIHQITTLKSVLFT